MEAEFSEFVLLISMLCDFISLISTKVFKRHDAGLVFVLVVKDNSKYKGFLELGKALLSSLKDFRLGFSSF